MKDSDISFYAALSQMDQLEAETEQLSDALSAKREALRNSWKSLDELRERELEKCLNERGLGICWSRWHRYGTDESLEGMGVFPLQDMAIQYVSGATKITVGYEAYDEGWYVS